MQVIAADAEGRNTNNDEVHPLFVMPALVFAGPARAPEIRDRLLLAHAAEWDRLEQLVQEQLQAVHRVRRRYSGLPKRWLVIARGYSRKRALSLVHCA
jgi:hypothetical protein